VTSRTAALGAAIVLLAAAGVTAWPAAAKDACGTAWASKVEPPESILVHRTASGDVEEVGLKHYVAVVMASGEWPSSLPVATLEAGAQATKQYAWYHALKGNHRDGYVTASGTCYDVRDDSEDQVYQPESAEPTDKQKDARDALWGLSLRKNGEFFLTGYRQGSATTCGADADEWKLYATSATDCAHQGLDGLEILHTYYSPRLTDTWAEGTEPSATDDPEQAGEPEAGVDRTPAVEDDLNAPETSVEASGEKASAKKASDEGAGPLGSILDGIRSLFEEGTED
jgi:hypothetical protein